MFSRELLGGVVVAVAVVAAGCAVEGAEPSVDEPAAQVWPGAEDPEPKITEIIATGPNCPPGSYVPSIAPSGDRATVAFDAFAATLRSTDEENSAKYEARAACDIVVRYAEKLGVSYGMPDTTFQDEIDRSDSVSARWSTNKTWRGATPVAWEVLPRSGTKWTDPFGPRVTWSDCGGTKELHLSVVAALNKRIGTPWQLAEHSLRFTSLDLARPLVRRCDERPFIFPPSNQKPDDTPAAIVSKVQSSGDGCPEGSAQISSDGASLRVDLRATGVTLSNATWEPESVRVCHLEVEVNAPPGQTFTVRRRAVTGEASIPDGFVGSIHRDAEGQAFSKPILFDGPYAMGFTLDVQYDPASPFVGEDPPRVPCGQKTMSLGLVTAIRRVPPELRVNPPRLTPSLSPDASIKLVSEELAFSLRPCAE